MTINVTRTPGGYFKAGGVAVYVGPNHTPEQLRHAAEVQRHQAECALAVAAALDAEADERAGNEPAPESTKFGYHWHIDRLAHSSAHQPNDILAYGTTRMMSTLLERARDAGMVIDPATLRLEPIEGGPNSYPNSYQFRLSALGVPSSPRTEAGK